MGKNNSSKKPSKSLPKLSLLEIAEIGGTAVECISGLIHTIGEERRKTEELKTERFRISAELEAKISETENETVRLLGQYQLEIEKLAAETKQAEIDASRDIESSRNTHEERMLQIRADHERRMRHLDIIEKIIDLALKQYDYYSNSVILQPQASGNTSIIDMQLLDKMNSTILSLNSTLSVAYLDAPSF